MNSGYPKWAPYVLISPFLAVFIVFMAYPMLYSLVLAAQQTHGPQTRQFVFLDNFYYLLTDPLFWKAMRNTFVFAAGSVFIQLPLSLGLAMLLNHPKVRTLVPPLVHDPPAVLHSGFSWDGGVRVSGRCAVDLPLIRNINPRESESRRSAGAGARA